MPGHHNVYNALAAVAVGQTLGVDIDAIRAGLKKTKLSKYRSQVIEMKDGPCVINDAYNANPTSMQAALDMLEIKKEKLYLNILRRY